MEDKYGLLERENQKKRQAVQFADEDIGFILVAKE